MSDLLSPIYVVFEGNEADAFWGLVGVMEIMVRPTASSGLSLMRPGVQFPAGSEWHEAATVNATAADRRDGSGAVHASRYALPSLRLMGKADRSQRGQTA